jgi:ABC-type transporter Mla subunit MlaD
VARLPGIDAVAGGVLSVLNRQADSLAALPDVVRSLTSAVGSLVEVAGQARDTVAAVQRLAVRMDAIVAELEEPLLALRPGLVRLAAVLDDPVVEELPDTLRQVQADVLPVLRTLADTHERVAFIAGQTDRIMTFVDETGRTLAGLPGAALLGRRRIGTRPVPPPAAPPPVVPPVL